MSQPWTIISGQNNPYTLADMEEGILAGCLAHRLDCLVIPPLYHIPERSRIWSELGKYVENAILLCELHPRPAEWLLCHHQISAKSMTILDLRKFSDAKAAMDAVMAIAPDRARASQGTDRLRDALDSSPGRIEQLDESCGSRWYPVVDFSRCTGCLDCLQFCLFGVYEQDPQGKLVVRNPDKCKPGCPACSRICPQSAIMFPLFGDAAIAGASGQWITPEGADDGAPIARGAKNVTVLASEPLPFDDLDLLVEQLDQQTKRRG